MSDHAVNGNGNGNAHGPSAALSLSSSSAQLLPPELWQHVLEVCHPSDLQHTALALSRAIPNAGITLKNLFHDVRITRDVQAGQVVRRIGPRYPDAAQAREAARSFTGLAWRTDSNVLVNLVTSFPHLKSVVLHVGPLFAPEHLEELVQLERPKLETLALRFNPYVDKASYTIFLKGLYFDTGILRLAKWPVTPNLKHLSLVQDPIPSYHDLVAAAFEAGTTAPTKAYAQPIVFFKLSCLSTLATSPVSSHITNVRLRIPGRSILTAISTASTSSTVIPATHSATLPKPFPSLEHLDISTTYVACDAALQGLLKRHPSMRYLVADRSGLIRFGMADHTCQDIGRTVASIGVSRATEAMKVFRAAYRAQQARMQAQHAARQAALERANNHQANGAGAEHAAQRAVEQAMQAEIRAARRGRSSYATERRPRSAHMPPSAASTAALDEVTASLAALVVSTTVSRPVILPAAPALTSLACGLGGHDGLDDELRAEWDDEFSEGWDDGLQRVVAVIHERLDEFNRLCARARNATHKSAPEDRIFPTLVRFRTPEERKERAVRAAALGVSLEDLDEREGGSSGKDILGTLDLVPCDVAEAIQLIDAVKASACSLCTIPDCPSEGRIAWTELSEAEKRSQGRWRRPAREHKAGCAHLVGRGIWDRDAQDV